MLNMQFPKKASISEQCDVEVRMVQLRVPLRFLFRIVMDNRLVAARGLARACA